MNVMSPVTVMYGTRQTDIGLLCGALCFAPNKKGVGDIAPPTPFLFLFPKRNQKLWVMPSWTPVTESSATPLLL